MTGQDYIKNRSLHPFWDESREPNREDVVDAFEQGKAEGAKWMREKMMKEAVEGVVINNHQKWVFAGNDAMNQLLSNYNEGDKVKLIIIKGD